MDQVIWHDVENGAYRADLALWRALREEMEYQPPQRRVVVEEAQGRIVSIIRRLEEAGEIMLSRSAGDDEVV
jgi:flagellar motor switch protein FliG